MNETIYIVEMVRVCFVFCFFVCCFFCCFFFFWKKKEERMLKQKHDISDGLFGTTGIYQKCLSNIHTEFLANN